MPGPPDPSLDAFPDSPYAAELQRGALGNFSPELEREYVRAGLSDKRMLIRAACLLAVLLSALRGIENAVRGFPDYTDPLLLLSVLLGSVVLTCLAFCPAYERCYLPAARIVVPARNAAGAFVIGAAAAHGQVELLMLLSLMVIGPFFFVGFSLRMALFSVVGTVLSFAVSADLFALPAHVALHAEAFLIMAVTASAFGARHFERRLRRSFLEDRLIKELAASDALTGTKNRRVFAEHLGRVWQQAAEDGRTLAILLIDVDHFKAYNDRYGHQAGDDALRTTAKAVQTLVTRPLDVLARYGGEEFVAILYDVGRDEAEEVARAMCEAVRESGIEHRGGVVPVLTISIGVAVIEPNLERNPRGALQLADEALYEAKTKGRNRVEVMDDVEYRRLVTGVFAKASIVRSA
ncbi:MAG TPA: GGDEF domain-containing protein [Gammaproteobacteria bacterium]|nr:GGDEF domain-containing protein [Gammaproteobacteria bacterium]